MVKFTRPNQGPRGGPSRTVIFLACLLFISGIALHAVKKNQSALIKTNAQLKARVEENATERANLISQMAAAKDEKLRGSANGKEYEIARQQSFDFFQDVPEDSWNLKRGIMKDWAPHADASRPLFDRATPVKWYAKVCRHGATRYYEYVPVYIALLPHYYLAKRSR